MIFTGIQADDDLQGHFGVALADALCLPVITAVSEIRVDAAHKTATVTRELGAGFKEELEVDLPCLLTVQFGIRPVRYTPVMAIVKARSRKIEAVSGEALEIAPHEPGASARLRVVELSYPADSGKCELIAGSAEEAARELVRRLMDGGVV
jgi:electron transfer flavoprotein alpha/beta subunit